MISIRPNSIQHINLPIIGYLVGYGPLNVLLVDCLFYEVSDNIHMSVLVEFWLLNSGKWGCCHQLVGPTTWVISWIYPEESIMTIWMWAGNSSCGPTGTPLSLILTQQLPVWSLHPLYYMCKQSSSLCGMGFTPAPIKSIKGQPLLLEHKDPVWAVGWETACPTNWATPSPSSW